MVPRTNHHQLSLALLDWILERFLTQEANASIDLLVCEA